MPMSEPALRVVRGDPFNAESRIEALALPITPTRSAYVRSNFAVPTLSGHDHRISVSAVDGRALGVAVGELDRLLLTSITSTMECAGNSRVWMRPLPAGEPWDHGAVSTSRWTGVPLATLLARDGFADGAIEVIVEGADAGPRDDAGGESETVFARSLPIATAMHPDTLLALYMSDEPLPAEHGGPVRLVVPGWYGMASVKWVTRVVATARPFDGYFQTHRYVYRDDDAGTLAPVTTMLVKSLMTAPVDGATLPPGRTSIEGWAWSGQGPIARVEVATAGGDAWTEARLCGSVSPHAWTRWEYEWEPPAAGRYALRCRARDARGNIQPEQAVWNSLGYGNNAVQTILVDVR